MIISVTVSQNIICFPYMNKPGEESLKQSISKTDKLINNKPQCFKNITKTHKDQVPIS